jgi:hypothetical protein
MTEVVVIVDLPIATVDHVDATELAMLLRDVKAAQIIDYVDSQDVQITPTAASQTMLDVEQDARGYQPNEGQEPPEYWGRT